MDVRAGVIGFSSSKTCFISLPACWMNGFTKPGHQTQLSVYELTDGTHTAYVSWAGDVLHNQSEGVEINGLFAAKLGFQHGAQVTVKPVQNVPSASRIHIEPVSPDDWEILELHAGFIESNLLNQVRLVWEHQVLPVWVTKSTCIFVTVEKLEPSSRCALLQELTEVIVSPKVRHNTRQTSHVVKPASNLMEGKTKNMSNGKPPVNTSSEKMPSVTAHTQNVEKDGRVKSSTQKHGGDKIQAIPEDKKHVCSQTHFNLLWDVFSYFKSFVFQTQEESETPPTSVIDSEEIWKSSVNSKLRVQSLQLFDARNTNPIKKLPSLESIHNSRYHDKELFNIAEQPTTVHVLASSLAESHDGHVIGQSSITFIAKLTKLPSPVEVDEKAEKLKKQDILTKDKDMKDKDGKNSSPEKTKGPKDTDLHNSSFVRVVVVEDLESAGNPQCKIRPLKGQLLMSDTLRRQVGYEVNSCVHLQSVGFDAMLPAEVRLAALVDLPPKFLPEMVVFAFKSWLSQVASARFPLVCDQGTLIKIPMLPDYDGEFLVTFTEKPTKDTSTVPPGGQVYYALHPDVMKDIKLTYTGQLTSKNKPAEVKVLPFWSVSELDTPPLMSKLENLGGITELSKLAINHLTMSLALRPLAERVLSGSAGVSCGGLLISGSRGCGKSSLARAVCTELRKYPHLVYVRVIDCKPLRAKRVESIKAMWLKVFNEAAWRQPSVILLDDLDHVTPSPSGHEQEMSGEAVYYARVAKVLTDILNSEMVQQSRLAIMATSHSRASLHHSLVSSRGIHYFQEFISIKPPTLSQRKSMLDAIVASKQTISLETMTSADLQHWATKTQGCVARDLVKLVDRAVHARHMMGKDSKSREVCLDDSCFEQALQDFQPSSLQNVSLHKAGDLGWQDVGNLTEVKETLMETLQWPAKYPALFANCPLRLRSGILLYGAPGTGKTLLAGVVAKECGLNFISIKGPELLSKYIGASEQAVRDTFNRAQSAKPCVLFFDEFDAIAPRRGHDSTGVTDRVVNQLLTQLDGVEGLDGVYVLAATSRPDLIDPALLRPGRLDKCICCPLPDENGRYEILQALSRSISLSDNVHLHSIAAMCEHFTGADFKALLYNAQLEAIQQSSSYRYSAVYQSTVDQEAVKDEVDKTIVVFEKDSSQSQPDILYMPTLEEGVVDISSEMKDKLLTELGPWVKSKTENLSENKKSVPVSITITQENLENAASNMRPSVSEKERLKYRAIYENFIGCRGGNFASTQVPAEKRQTLA